VLTWLIIRTSFSLLGLYRFSSQVCHDNQNFDSGPARSVGVFCRRRTDHSADVGAVGYGRATVNAIVRELLPFLGAGCQVSTDDGGEGARVEPARIR
jgi:hypothetical protein